MSRAPTADGTEPAGILNATASDIARTLASAPLCLDEHPGYAPRGRPLTYLLFCDLNQGHGGKHWEADYDQEWP